MVRSRIGTAVGNSTIIDHCIYFTRLGKVREEYKEGFAMAHGYRGKTLHLDLTNRNLEVMGKGDPFYRTYLGGRGIGYNYPLTGETTGS